MAPPFKIFLNPLLLAPSIPFSLTYLKFSSSCPQGDSNLRPSDNWQSLDRYSHSATWAEMKSYVFSWDISFKVRFWTKFCKSLNKIVGKMYLECNFRKKSIELPSPLPRRGSPASEVLFHGTWKKQDFGSGLRLRGKLEGSYFLFFPTTDRYIVILPLEMWKGKAMLEGYSPSWQWLPWDLSNIMVRWKWPQNAYTIQVP